MRGAKEKPMAELTEVISGAAEKQVQESAWMSAALGDGFRSRDAVRTSSDGSLRLTFNNGAVLRLGSSTTLRFGPKLSLIGEVQNESPGATTLQLDGNKNLVKLQAGAKIRINQDQQGRSSIEVLVGSALVTTEDGEFDLDVGETIELVIGGGSVAPLPDIDAAPPAPIDAAPVPIDAAPVIAAVTVKVTGRGVAVKDSADAKERKLAAGDHELAAGSILSIRRGSSISVVRGPEEAEVRGKAAATIGEIGAPLLDVSRGRVVVIGKEAPTTVSIPGGRVVARAASGRGSKIDIVVGSKSKVTPKSGRADVISSKARERIQIGERIEITRNGDIGVFGRQPKVADFSIRAGVSASIHDPGAPTALRLRFEDKCSDGIVTWKGRGASQNVRGSGSAITLLRPGSHRYEVHCIVDGDQQVASVVSGRIKVDRGSGTKPIPAKPPHNIIDATGERYEIRYQNLLPHVTIRWPNAKKDGSYKLHVKRSSGSSKVYSTKGASHRVKNLREGSYRFWFVGNGTRSKEGLMTIKFDNAATAGYLRRPRVGESWSGGQVLLQGAGVPGTEVSVGGVRLELDGQSRFKASVGKPASEDAVAVKFVAPGQGTHYYVRRDGKR